MSASSDHNLSSSAILVVVTLGLTSNADALDDLFFVRRSQVDKLGQGRILSNLPGHKCRDADGNMGMR